MRLTSIKALATALRSQGLFFRNRPGNHRRGRHVPRSAVCQMGGCLQQGDRRPHQLPVCRLGRRFAPDSWQDGRFRASDMPLTDEELQKDGLMQFPTVIGGVVPVFNIPASRRGRCG